VESCTKIVLNKSKWLRKQSINTQVVRQIWGEIKSWLPSLTWFLPLLSPLVAKIILLKFCPCIRSLLVKFVSSRLETITLQMMMAAEMHMPKILSWYQRPFDKPPPSLRRP
jgi:hypothetical protein